MIGGFRISRLRRVGALDRGPVCLAASSAEEDLDMLPFRDEDV